MAEAKAWTIIPKLDKDGCVLDMMPLVLCKDCMHLKKLPIDHHGHQPYWCENLNIYTEGLAWFCADGECK